ncbi:MAG: hypothetical protein AB7D47_09800 [Desulfovibrio sp.]
MSRLINPKDIPEHLWESKSETLYLPTPLIEQWEALLKINNLADKAQEKAPDGFVGGMSKEDTDNHFAWRFTGSCARTMLSFLDPKDDLGKVADAYARAFAGNQVFLVDLPCGSGAATASILTTLANLREFNVIPRMPINIVIVGGEISEYARDYTQAILKGIESYLNQQAIWIEYQAIAWDVCDPMSNSSLVKKLTLAGHECHTKLLMLTNFSNFLEKNNKWPKAKPQLEELFRHSRDQESLAVWIEPSSKAVKNGFFSRLPQWFTKIFRLNPSEDLGKSEDKHAESHAHAQHPLRANRFRVNLVVRRFDLPNEM